MTSARVPGRRRAMVSICVLAALALAASVVVAVFTSVTFFGETPTDRNLAISGHAMRGALFALATPFCCWFAFDRRRGVRLAAELSWLALLLHCRWWWWPGPPSGYVDSSRQLWHTWAGWILWSLVAVALATDVDAAGPQRRPVIGAIAAALLVSIGVTHLQLADHEGDLAGVERPTSAAEVTALATDPVWVALGLHPDAPHPGRTLPWGAVTATWQSADPVAVEVATDPSTDATIEAAGWHRVEPDLCGATTSRQFQKLTDAGAATLWVRVPNWPDSHPDLVVQIDPPGLRAEDRCFPTIG